MYSVKLIASTEPATHGDIMSVLGISWTMLAVQIVAFLLLVWLLGKFVYPWLMKSIDDRQEKIEESIKAANNAEKHAAQAEEQVAKLVDKAKKEANEIVSNAKSESAEMVKTAEEKASKRSEQIIKDANEQISKNVLTAKKELHNEMLELVTMATEKIVSKSVSGSINDKLVQDAIKESN